ncbi:hypothetical protein [Streptomyces sp. NPDC088915]|uniref:hypothetical protein n=1 Tax=Streptomyces sp. NPDC088915 TaxID=3365912 RepID=UPI003801BDC4
MSTLALNASAAAPAVFPPPSVPSRFWDGDRYEWSTGDVWERSEGQWVPVPDDGSGSFTDAEVRHALARAVDNRDPGHRFVPRPPGAILPGMRVHSLLDLFALSFQPARSAAQYLLEHQDGRLVAGRELIAAHDEDAAHDFPAVIPLWMMRYLLKEIVQEQRRPEVSYHRPSGRLYVRYERPVDLPGRETVECVHVFVLSNADVHGGA